LDLLNYLLIGFQVAFQPQNLFYCFTGVVIGTLVGVLPGMGPVAAMSLLLPATFHISPIGAMIMLAGIYYGASTAVPPPPSWSTSRGSGLGHDLSGRVPDGPSRPGRPALGIAAFGSFIAGTIGILGLVLIAPP